MHFKRLKEILISFFDNYYFRVSELALYFFYNYQKIITIIESIFKKEKDIAFSYNYPNLKKSLMAFENKIWHYINSINGAFIY